MQHIQPVSEEINGYHLLFNTLKSWGISHYAGVTGGGVIHFLKHLQRYDNLSGSGFLTLGEYSAGFFPLGYFFSTGKIAAAVATTGAATKLLACGLSDAKLHDIPAVFIIAQSEPHTYGLSPLQDTSAWGSNIIAQLRCELPDGVFVLDNSDTLTSTLEQAQYQLSLLRPIVLVVVHSSLNKPAYKKLSSNEVEKSFGTKEVVRFISHFKTASTGKKITLLVGEEMARLPNAKQITTKLSSALRAQTIWSINGANAIERSNPYGYGYISFGGNDRAISLYETLNDNDVLLIIGACPDEYTVNLMPFKSSRTFYLSHIATPYGQVPPDVSQKNSRDVEFYSGNPEEFLTALITTAEQGELSSLPCDPAPANLNTRVIAKPQQGYTDMVSLYKDLDRLWPAQSICFDDVCLAYKDRQYVTQRPNDNIMIYSLYRGSAMGGAFGLAIGARLTSPNRPVYCFTGDGCFRLFSGSLGEASRLGIIIFLLNNGRFSIVSQGLPVIIPDLHEEASHIHLDGIDYCGVARAHGWNAVKVSADLNELPHLLQQPLKAGETSLLIEITVDPEQILGQNPRVRNL